MQFEIGEFEFLVRKNFYIPFNKLKLNEFVKRDVEDHCTQLKLGDVSRIKLRIMMFCCQKLCGNHLW